jgi:hypothetical protein
MAKKTWNYGGSPKYKILWKDGMSPPLAHLYRWEGRTFGKTYVIKAGSYWEHVSETHWEPREHVGNLREQRKNETPPHPPPAPKLFYNKNQGTLSACWAFPFVAWNFYFQNCSSPFLAWANTPIINWGYLFIGYYFTYLIKAKNPSLGPI